MLAKPLGLALIAVMVMGAAAKPKPPPAKPAAPAAAKPATARATSKAAPIADFDAQNPMSVIALLNTNGAKATLVQKQDDLVQVAVTSVAANFGMIFAGCDAQGRKCKVVQFDYADDKPGPSFAQVNAFNQTSATCRSYEDKASKPHILYSTLLFADDPYAHFRDHVAAWTGCIGEFRNFLKDPSAYLASAP
ncbi:MAG TPA: hypothetical protein VGC92_03415 [Phenylobacterium sp.]